MGHKANITSLGFHPFGDFLASSSMDTNIKVSVRLRLCLVPGLFFTVDSNVVFSRSNTSSCGTSGGKDTCSGTR